MNKNDVISRKAPQLVKSVLGPNTETLVYEKCLENVLNLLRKPREPEPQDRVAQNMTLFLERFDEEQLQHVGRTVKVLANVITNEQSCSKPLQYAWLDFMLSVNYCAFRQARRNYEARLRAGERILANLAEAYGKQTETPDPAPNDSSSSKSETSSSQSSASESDSDFKHAFEAKKSCHIKLLSPKQFNVSWLRQYLGPGLSTFRFAVCYGKYLQSQLQGTVCCDTEEYLLRELLLMFFLPDDYYYFKVIRNCVQLAPERGGIYPVERQSIERFVQPLQNMHLLQVYMDCYHTRIEFETWNNFTSALRHLMKPLVETLTHFEHNLTKDSDKCSVAGLWQASKANFTQLQLLCQLSAENCGARALPTSTPTHVRALLLLTGLLQQTGQTRLICTQPQARKGHAAALLLHTLQIYCKCLDNWWQVGDFQDTHAEFVAERIVLEGRSKYPMRQVNEDLRQSPLHKILRRHIKTAAHYVALLHDSQSFNEFRTLHKRWMENSLYSTLLRSLRELLKPYRVKRVRQDYEGPAPDIYKQIYATKDEQMSCYYYVYYKESESEFSLALLQRLQCCVSYTPFDKLVCSALQQQLEQRATLIRSYVLHLLCKQLKVSQKCAHLRSVCLLLNFKLFGKGFEEFWQLLQQGNNTAAAAHLQSIIETHNLGLTDKFEVHLPSCDLEELSLKYTCEPALGLIITQPQLQRYNAAFRRLFPLQLMLRKLQMLPELVYHGKAMQEVREGLMQQLVVYLDLQSMNQSADRCNVNLSSATSLPQLQNAHAEFVQVMEDSVLRNSLTCPDSQLNAQDLFRISDTFIKLWQRLLRMWHGERVSSQAFWQMDMDQATKKHFAVQYKLKMTRYLSNLADVTQAVQFMLDSKDR